MKAEEIGSGAPLPWEAEPTVLFVHGMWHGDWCWDPLLRLFRDAGFDAHTLNLSSHGGRHAGSRKRIWHVMGTYLDDLRTAANKLPSPPILVGHSMGCYLIEVLMAELRPPAVILLAPTRPGIFARSVSRFARNHFPSFVSLVIGHTMWPPIRNLPLCRELLFTNEVPENELARLHTEKLQNESYLAATQLLLAAFPPGRWLALAGPLPKPFRTPVLVLSGSLDKAVLPEDAHAVADYYGADREIFPGMAHDLMLEPNPHVVADRMLTWLKEKQVSRRECLDRGRSWRFSHEGREEREFPSS